MTSFIAAANTCSKPNYQNYRCSLLPSTNTHLWSTKDKLSPAVAHLTPLLTSAGLLKARPSEPKNWRWKSSNKSVAFKIWSKYAGGRYLCFQNDSSIHVWTLTCVFQSPKSDCWPYLSLLTRPHGAQRGSWGACKLWISMESFCLRSRLSHFEISIKN